VPTVHPSADVHPSAHIGEGTVIWHHVHVREGAQIGAQCSVGRGSYIGAGVVMGDRCKVQNAAQVYEPASIGAGVFIGPAVILTNDRFPRAVAPDGTRKSAQDWVPVGVTVLEGASLGANSTAVAPVTIGRWSLVAAGATVTADVPDFALVAGTPARRVGWVGRSGQRLVPRADGRLVCPTTGQVYEDHGEQLLETEELA